MPELETGPADEEAGTDELGAGQKLVYQSQYALSSALSQVSEMQELTSLLPQRSSFDVTPYSSKQELQQLGVGVADGTVDEEGTSELETGAASLEEP